MKAFGLFSKGLITRNPTLILLLCIAPSLVFASKMPNGLAAGIAATVILTLTNAVLSLLRRVIPEQIKLICYALVIALLITCVDLLMQALFPLLPIGALIPLIVVNCVVLLCRKNRNTRYFIPVLDGFITGVGFTVSLLLFNAVRELLTDGIRYGIQILPFLTGLTAAGLAAAGFAAAAMQFLIKKHRKKKTISGFREDGDVI
jgi:electron transport complex protein RnfE